MDWSALTDALLTTQTPLLPDVTVLLVARRISWALVLACLLLYFGRTRWPLVLRRALSVVLLAWAFLPGPLSPAFWLGLAYQTPSLMSTLLAALCLARWLRAPTPVPLGAEWRRAWVGLSLAGMALGWLLLLDTFAVLPISNSFYAWGFSPAALGVAAVLAALPWLLRGQPGPAMRVSGLLASVLVLYVTLRLPNGNLWSALLDPWLWVALHLGWMYHGVRRLMAWRAAKATRA